MTIWQRFVIFFLGVFGKIEDAHGHCGLCLRADFGHPHAVYIKNGDFLTPNGHNGSIILRQAEKLLIACPGNKNHVVIRGANGTTIKKAQVVEASCIGGKYFQLDDLRIPFKNITCNSLNTVTVKKTTQKCGEGKLYNLYKVGYEILDKLYSLYEACFDEARLTTLFVRHTISPQNQYVQQDRGRNYFNEGGLFRAVSMNDLYKLDNQKARIDAILGENEHKKYYHNWQFLSRGHLAPRADFTLLAELRATYQYVNTAPQWIKNNAGPWAALEDSLRRFVSKLSVRASVLTGTHGVLTLPDKNGIDQEIYLNTDQNNNGLVPVPLYFYKVVDAPGKPRVAYVTINSSFYNRTELESLRFCADLCEYNEHWLVWKKKGPESFCCDYQQFKEVVGYLPD